MIPHGGPSFAVAMQPSCTIIGMNLLNYARWRAESV
jgi:hypothetical protein